MVIIITVRSSSMIETMALHIIKHYNFILDKIDLSILRPLRTLHTPSLHFWHLFVSSLFHILPIFLIVLLESFHAHDLYLVSYQCIDNNVPVPVNLQPIARVAIIQHHRAADAIADP